MSDCRHTDDCACLDVFYHDVSIKICSNLSEGGYFKADFVLNDWFSHPATGHLRDVSSSAEDDRLTPTTSGVLLLIIKVCRYEPDGCGLIKSCQWMIVLDPLREKSKEQMRTLTVEIIEKI
jgi:hypothetical protein